MPVDLNLVASLQKLSYCHAEYFHFRFLLVLLDVAIEALTVVVCLIATLAISACLNDISTATRADDFPIGRAIPRAVHISMLGDTNRHIVLKAHWALVYFIYHRYPSCSLLSCSDILSTQSSISNSAATSSIGGVLIQE